MVKSTRDKVEDWIKNAPKEIRVSLPVDMEAVTDKYHTMGRITPEFLQPKYHGTIEFNCDDWEYGEKS